MIYILTGVCVALLVVCIMLSVHIFSLKKQMKSIKNELPLTRDKGYNRQLTVTLIDNDLSAMVTEINHNLDYQKKLKFKTEQAERILKQSVSDIAHDLRTPLTVIKGNLQMIEKEEKLTPRGYEYLRVCMEKADAMKIMADDFFELSVLESDSTPVTLNKVNITNILMEFIADHESIIRANNLTPRIIFPEKTVFARADEAMLMRMLSNLLNNVIKYGKEVFTLMLETKEQCIITISNGIENSELEADKLFDRAYRGDKARRGNGAGLGLYIVKLLAEKQNAQVKAEISNNELSISIILNIPR